MVFVQRLKYNKAGTRQPAQHYRFITHGHLQRRVSRAATEVRIGKKQIRMGTMVKNKVGVLTADLN